MRRCAGYSRSLGRTGIRSEDLGQARYTAAGWWDASSGVTLSGPGGSACVRVMIAQLCVIAITRKWWIGRWTGSYEPSKVPGMVVRSTWTELGIARRRYGPTSWRSRLDARSEEVFSEPPP